MLCKGAFVVTSEGHIRTATTLDRETLDNYELTVISMDRGRPVQLMHNTTVSITVTDINDNTPIIIPFLSTAEIREVCSYESNLTGQLFLCVDVHVVKLSHFHGYCWNLDYYDPTKIIFKVSCYFSMCIVTAISLMVPSCVPQSLAKLTRCFYLCSQWLTDSTTMHHTVI